MDLQKLKYFYEVAKIQHVTKAAESINIAQPALTQAIKSLEKELGVDLFVKKGRNIILTDCGEYLKKRLDSILPEIESLPREMEQLKARKSKTIKLNILAASTFVINSIVEYRKIRDEVIFDFEQNERKSDSDIVITTNSIEGVSSKGYKKRCIKNERIYLAVPEKSEYSRREAIDLPEVRDEGFVMLSNSRLFGVICAKFCTSAGFTPKVMFASDSPMAVQNIIGTGTGIAFWPEYSWGKLDDSKVVLIPIREPECSRELIIELYERVPHSEYADEFYKFLIDRLG